MRLILLALLVPLCGALSVPAALAMSDSMATSRALALESSSKAVLVCVDGKVTRRPAKPRESAWEQVFGVPEFRCGDWRVKEELDRNRSSYAADASGL